MTLFFCFYNGTLAQQGFRAHHTQDFSLGLKWCDNPSWLEQITTYVLEFQSNVFPLDSKILKGREGPYESMWYFQGLASCSRNVSWLIEWMKEPINKMSNKSSLPNSLLFCKDWDSFLPWIKKYVMGRMLFLRLSFCYPKWYVLLNTCFTLWTYSIKSWAG